MLVRLKASFCSPKTPDIRVGNPLAFASDMPPLCDHRADLLNQKVLETTRLRILLLHSTRKC